MSRLTTISYNDLIRKLKMFGFYGPFSGGKHLYMGKDNLRLTVPNPHKQKIGVELQMRIIRQAGITRGKWIEE